MPGVVFQPRIPIVFAGGRTRKARRWATTPRVILEPHFIYMYIHVHIHTYIYIEREAIPTTHSDSLCRWDDEESAVKG